MNTDDIPLKAKAIKRVEVRLDQDLWDEAQRHGIDVPQLFKNSLKHTLRKLKPDHAGCNTVFPRVTEAAKAATQPPVRTTYSRKKK